MKLSSTGYLIKEGFKNVWNNRMMSLASVAVLISCLIITGAASLISLNVSSLIAAVGDDNELTVYLKYELSDTDSVKIGPQLKKIDNIEQCRYYSKEEAIKQYKDTLGNVYESMQGDGNPFGNAYKIRLTDLSKYKSTVKQIKQIDGVDSVSDRSEIAGKLTKLNYFVTLVGFWVVLVLGIVTLFIISNTIKITMYSRRFEISIMKSVGATNAFVRVPFVIEAMLIGLLAGLTASGILIALYNPVKDAASGIVNLIANSTIPVEQLWLPILVSMSVIGMIIGILGGLISITKYLRKEGGEILGW
ncbi:MAG: permease-like cell division protein FtsX [Clostridia bacterium]|nr:permease-like cell division protein FtsX [Clostridia bacterium]